jgi:hypothetical protein
MECNPSNLIVDWNNIISSILYFEYSLLAKIVDSIYGGLFPPERNREEENDVVIYRDRHIYKNRSLVNGKYRYNEKIVAEFITKQLHYFFSFC